MLRGVNKQIIEINSTDNRYFEKAILFIRPEFADMSEAKLRDNASEFLKLIETEKDIVKPINNPKKTKLKKNKKLVFLFGGTAAIVAVCVGIILKFM